MPSEDAEEGQNPWGGGRKKFLVPAYSFFFGGYPPKGGGTNKKFARKIFRTPKAEISLTLPHVFGFGRCKEDIFQGNQCGGPALSPWLACPVGGQTGFCDPCVPGAVGASVWTPHQPHSVCALVGWRCSLWGWRRASPGGGVPFTISGQALPLPRPPALPPGCRGPLPMCCERGCAGVGAQHCPLGLHALWGLRAAGVVGGRPRGGGGLPPL